MALFSIRSARLNEKPTWGQVWRRALTDVFGAEGIHDDIVGRYHATGETCDLIPSQNDARILEWSKVPTSVFTLIKILNPFKFFIEFPLTLLHAVTDRLCQIGALAPGEAYDANFNRYFVISERPRSAFVGPSYGFFRTLLRWMVQTLFGLPLALVRHVTSPVNTVIRPLVQYAQHHPWKFLFLVVGVSALLTVIIAAGVLTGGLANFGIVGTYAAMVPGVAKFVALSATASTALTASIGSGMAMFGVTVSWLATAVQIGIITATAVSAMLFTRHLLSTFTHYYRDLFSLGVRGINHKEYHAEGFVTEHQDKMLSVNKQREQALELHACDYQGGNHYTKTTTYSRLQFSTAGNASEGRPVEGMSPCEQSIFYSAGSFFGIVGTFDSKSSKEYKAYREGHRSIFDRIGQGLSKAGSAVVSVCSPSSA